MARLPKNDKVVDIGTIAAALGVSKTTVSRAISGNGRVGAATRQRVQDYVKEHNYTPSVMARGLAMRCSYNISLVISKQFSDFEMPFLRKTIRSVYQVAEDCDYDVLLTLVGENETRPVERLLDNRKIDGLILTRTLERDPLIPLLKSRKLPFVAIGRPEDPTVMSVDHDQVGGCRELPPVNEHTNRRATLAHPSCLIQPLCRPTGPGALVLGVPVERGRCVLAHAGILPDGGFVFSAWVRPPEAYGGSVMTASKVLEAKVPSTFRASPWRMLHF